MLFCTFYIVLHQAPRDFFGVQLMANPVHKRTLTTTIVYSTCVVSSLIGRGG